MRPGGFGAVAINSLLLAYHVRSGGTWSGDCEVAELDSFLDHPGCKPREAKKHRTSKVELHQASMVFPIREAIDICERRAQRCKNLYDVINARGETNNPPGKTDEPPENVPGEGAAPLDNSSKAAEASSSGSKEQPGKAAQEQELLIPEHPRDNRGEGEMIEGNEVRSYIGSARVPGWKPEMWKEVLNEKERRDAQGQYLENLHTLQGGLEPDGADLTLKSLQQLRRAAAPSGAAVELAKQFGTTMKLRHGKGNARGDYWDVFEDYVVRRRTQRRKDVVRPKRRTWRNP